MSAWQLYPNHIWLADGHHTLVLLVMELPDRRVLGATVVDTVPFDPLDPDYAPEVSRIIASFTFGK